VLIPNLKQPGNDIDVYLKPLVDDLLLLWKEKGVRVRDAHVEEHFNLHALLFVTINDWPALSNLSGQSNKGYRACTYCLGQTMACISTVGRLYTWAIIDFFLLSIH
jgi:hypothetical protein